MFKRYLLLFIIVFSSLSGETYNHFNGEITYYGYHILHDWKGVSSNIKGFIEYNRHINKFKCDLKVPVQSFDSRNGNRDANMLIYTNALEYPDIRFTSNSIRFQGNKAIVDGLLHFGGVKKKIVSEVDVKSSKNLKFSGQLLLKLSDFNIKRPALFFRKIDDEIKINFQIEATKEKSNE